MRELKFKAKSKTTHTWLYGDVLRNERGEFAVVPPFKMNMSNECNLYEVDKETVCQFTGVYDRNGKEIYENDIVDTYPFERGYGVFTVLFASGYEENLGMPQGWYLQQGNFEKYIPLITSNEESEKVEVIGNRFDKPNLIEE